MLPEMARQRCGGRCSRGTPAAARGTLCHHRAAADLSFSPPPCPPCTAQATPATAPGTIPPQLKLCRDPAFQTFVISSATRTLQACAADDLLAPISAGEGSGAAGASCSARATGRRGGRSGWQGPGAAAPASSRCTTHSRAGTAGSAKDALAARDTFGVPHWRRLARPLFVAAQTAILSCTRNRAQPAACSKKEKDPTEALTQVSARPVDSPLIVFVCWVFCFAGPAACWCSNRVSPLLAAWGGA